MIAEAHSIREVLVDRQMSNTTQARQHQVHPEDLVCHDAYHLFTFFLIVVIFSLF